MTNKQDKPDNTKPIELDDWDDCEPYEKPSARVTTEQILGIIYDAMRKGVKS